MKMKREEDEEISLLYIVGFNKKGFLFLSEFSLFEVFRLKIPKCI